MPIEPVIFLGGLCVLLIGYVCYLLYWRKLAPPCNHEWEEVATFHSEPLENEGKCFWLPDDQRVKAMLGCTTLLLRCEACFALRQEEFLGTRTKSSSGKLLRMVQN